MAFEQPDIDVAIVGSGFSGIGMAIRLLAKQPKRSFVVLEMSDRIGGTWRDNVYPGCACDVPAHLYSYSFALNPDWSRLFAPRAEIRDYLERCVDEFGVRDHIRTGCEVTRCELDEAAALWRVEIASNGRRETITARYVVIGTGPLSRPAYPDIEGMESFGGASLHSARWDQSVDLAGKRVAVVGTGASAIQIVPQIAPLVKSLQVFQRSAPWIVPKADREFSADAIERFRKSPMRQRLHRWKIYWGMELRGLGFTVNPRINNMAAKIGREHIERQIDDPTLRDKVTPTYMPGCKRILLADDYYPALQRDNVDLVAVGVTRVTPTGVVDADGEHHEVDVIIYATGFAVGDPLGAASVVGRHGLDLGDVWSERMSAYMGTAIAGFPNLFVLLGPNTGLGHTSMVFMIESQVHYILSCMREVERRRARFIEVVPHEQVAFNLSLQPRLARAVWSSGCKSWYLDENGHNFSAWPGPTFEFWWRTRRPAMAHYRLSGVDRSRGWARVARAVWAALGPSSSSAPSVAS